MYCRLTACSAKIQALKYVTEALTVLWFQYASARVPLANTFPPGILSSACTKSLRGNRDAERVRILGRNTGGASSSRRRTQGPVAWHHHRRKRRRGSIPSWRRLGH